VCEGEDCQVMIRTDVTEPYIRYNDGTAGYACEKCLRQWRTLGILKVKSENIS
jgi:hypothetical protein